MSDPLLRELDHYVVLEPGGAEAILTAAETLVWLEDHLGRLAAPPADLAGLADPRERAQRLLEEYSESGGSGLKAVAGAPEVAGGESKGEVAS
jgi:hypothetical protein